MANEFKHLDAGAKLTRTEDNAVGRHIFNSQATGDIMYARSATQLSRLAIGSTYDVLTIAGGMPAWTATLAGITLATPVIASIYQDAGKTKLLTLPAATDTLIGKATTDVLTNKTLTSPVINGTIATTGLTMPSFALAASGTITIPASGTMRLGDTDKQLDITPWDEAGVGGVLLTPHDGNKIGFIALQPLGTSERSQISLYNAGVGQGTDFSVFNIEVNGDTVYFLYEDAGTPPTSIAHIELRNTWETQTLLSVTDKMYTLGTSSNRYESVFALHHQLTQALGSDHMWSGITATMTAGTALTRTQAVYVGGDSKMELSDADAAASMPIIALLGKATLAENASGEFLLQGFFRDDTWNWTIGGLLYASVTPGALSQTAPVGSGDQVQVVGVAISADIIYFSPSYELVEIS